MPTITQTHKTKEKQFTVGQLVLRPVDWAKKENRHKFGPQWQGPYRIIQINRPNVLLRELSEEARPFKIHMNKLKAFVETYTLPFRALTNDPTPEEPPDSDDEPEIIEEDDQGRIKTSTTPTELNEQIN